METTGTAEKTWETTSVSNLLRHRRSGRYYARFSLNGKRKMAALKTDQFSVAKIRLHKKLGEVEAQRRPGLRSETGATTMEKLFTQYRREFDLDSELSPNAKRAREFAVKRLERTWPEIGRMRPVAVTRDAIKAWSDRMHSDHPQPLQPGARKRRTGYAANSVNQAVDALRRILALACDAGAIHSNPFEGLKGRQHRVRKRVLLRRVNLPEAAACDAVFRHLGAPTLSPEIPQPFAEQLRSDAADVSELVRGLAFTGMRLGEAAAFNWEDVHADTIIVHGTKSEHSAEREVPIIPPMRALIEEMRARRSVNTWPLTGRIFRVRECQKSLDRACREAPTGRLRHHDLRHLFATRCIEAGVDIPTVARWLGHADGGALAMKVYGHLRREHSLAAAKKVTFGGAT